MAHAVNGPTARTCGLLCGSFGSRRRDGPCLALEAGHASIVALA